MQFVFGQALDQKPSSSVGGEWLYLEPLSLE